MFIKTSTRGLLFCYVCISLVAIVLLSAIYNRQKLTNTYKEQITSCRETIKCINKLHTFLSKSTLYSKTYIEKESTDALQNLSTSTDTLLRLTDTLTLLTTYNPTQQHKVKLLQLAVNEHVQYIDKIIRAIQNGIPSSAVSIYNNPMYGSILEHIKSILSQIENKEIAILKDHSQAISINDRELKFLYALLFANIMSIFMFRKKDGTTINTN